MRHLILKYSLTLACNSHFPKGVSAASNVAPGVLLICPLDKNRDSKTKTWILDPNIQILASKLHIFVPSGKLVPHRSMFSTWKIGYLIWGYQTFYALPKKTDFWPKTGIFGQIPAFWAHLVQYPTKKQCNQGAQVVFLLSRYQNFSFLPRKLGFLAQKRPNFA